MIAKRLIDYPENMILCHVQPGWIGGGPKSWKSTRHVTKKEDTANYFRPNYQNSVVDHELHRRRYKTKPKCINFTIWQIGSHQSTKGVKVRVKVLVVEGGQGIDNGGWWWRYRLVVSDKRITHRDKSPSRWQSSSILPSVSLVLLKPTCIREDSVGG